VVAVPAVGLQAAVVLPEVPKRPTPPPAEPLPGPGWLVPTCWNPIWTLWWTGKGVLWHVRRGLHFALCVVRTGAGAGALTALLTVTCARKVSFPTCRSHLMAVCCSHKPHPTPPPIPVHDAHRYVGSSPARRDYYVVDSKPTLAGKVHQPFPLRSPYTGQPPAATQGRRKGRRGSRRGSRRPSRHLPISG
jgi:hypothetical protein